MSMRPSCNGLSSMARSFGSLLGGGTAAVAHACLHLRGTCLLQRSRGMGTNPVGPKPRAAKSIVNFPGCGLPSWRHLGLILAVDETPHGAMFPDSMSRRCVQNRSAACPHFSWGQPWRISACSGPPAYPAVPWHSPAWLPAVRRFCGSRCSTCASWGSSPSRGGGNTGCHARNSPSCSLRDHIPTVWGNVVLWPLGHCRGWPRRGPAGFWAVPFAWSVVGLGMPGGSACQVFRV